LNRTDNARLPKLAFGYRPEGYSDTGKLFSRWPRSGAGYSLIREGDRRTTWTKLKSNPMTASILLEDKSLKLSECKFTKYITK
jgi:hypothetical protein